jgi:hypothetical protein
VLLSWFPSFPVDVVLRGMRVSDEWEEYVKVERDVSLPRLPLVDGLRGAMHEASESRLRQLHPLSPGFQVFLGHDGLSFGTEVSTDLILLSSLNVSMRCSARHVA